RVCQCLANGLELVAQFGEGASVLGEPLAEVAAIHVLADEKVAAALGSGTDSADNVGARQLERVLRLFEKARSGLRVDRYFRPHHLHGGGFAALDILRQVDSPDRTFSHALADDVAVGYQLPFQLSAEHVVGHLRSSSSFPSTAAPGLGVAAQYARF